MKQEGKGEGIGGERRGERGREEKEKEEDKKGGEGEGREGRERREVRTRTEGKISLSQFPLTIIQ